MELDCGNAAAWLKSQGVEAPHAKCQSLGGGVSNIVIRVESSAWRGVLKQSLGQLRVAEEWLSDRTRIFREAAAMRWVEGKLKGGQAPRLLLEDRQDFAIAMEAAPGGARMWKEHLFAGDLNPAHAEAAGRMLGSLIAVSYDNPDARALFGDQTVFRQLRIDPYYRFTATRHPACAPYIDDLIRRSSARAVSLTHGDWSPKNLLVDRDALWAIDWEVIHFGNPSFDAGFLLNHLLLKSIAMPEQRAGFAELAEVFLNSLGAELPEGARWIPGAAFEHLPALLLARVDGKSPAEYLTPELQDIARARALRLMKMQPRSINEVFA